MNGEWLMIIRTCRTNEQRARISTWCLEV